MKPKIYVGIAIVVFCVCLLVIYTAGLAQNYAIKQDKYQMIVDTSNKGTDIIRIENIQGDVHVSRTSATEVTIIVNTTNVVTTPTTPAPTPRPRPIVTRAS